MHQKIIDKLKEQYSRDLRKQLVKTMIKNEISEDTQAQESSYKIINQIFSYIISELGWSISQNTDNWDDAPLKIMKEVFPKIENTNWFKNQQLLVSKSINLEGNFS